MVFMSPSRCSSASLHFSSGDASGDQAVQPSPVGAQKRPNGMPVMVAIGVHRTENDVIIQHHRAVDRADIEILRAAWRRNSEQANDAARRRAAEQRRDHRFRAGALHHHVGVGPFQCGIEAEIPLAAQRIDQLRLAPAPVAVEHVHLELAFGAHQRRQQPDRAGARYQQAARPPRFRSGADPLDVIPCFGQDAGRLEEHAQKSERGIDPHRELRLDAKAIRTIAVAFLDTTLGVKAVAAHVPFAGGAGTARNRIGAADDADDEVAGREAARARRALDAPQRLVPQDQPRLAGRRGAVLAGNDLAVGAANTERHRAHEHAAIRHTRLGHILQAGRPGTSWNHGQCTQLVTI